MTTTSMRRAAGVVATVAAAAGLVAASVTATAAAPAVPRTATTATAAVPVAGTFSYHVGQDSRRPLVHGAVHAVRRLPGATVVYYSLGFPAGSTPSWLGVTPGPGLNGYGPYDVWSVSVVDPAGLRYYTPLRSGRRCLCSQTVDFDGSEAGRLVTGFAVVPALPASVTTVSVNLGYGTQVEQVPVREGALTPVAGGGRSTSVLGTGWPALPDDATIAAVADPRQFVRSMVRSVADTDRTVTTRERPGRVEVDLAADVLFAVGSARLSPAAQAKVAAVAADIARRGSGTVTVTGHTDSTGSPSSNQQLSQARAASVVAALRPRVPRLALTAVGRGESEPVADNGTAAGRQLNRRVSVSYRTGRPS